MSAGDTSTVPVRVFLTGMPGSGKSTVGRELARMIGHSFVDLDGATERLAGRTVQDLFSNGEAEFRRAERAALEETCGRSRVVVASGGGALASEAAFALASAAGRVVYLRASVPDLVERLHGRRDRPLLSDASGRPLSRDALRRRLEELLRERDGFYLRSHHVVDAAGRSARDVAREIADLVSRA